MLLVRILYPTVVILACYLLAVVGIYDPQPLVLNATQQYHVTTTEYQMPMEFVDDQSGFESFYFLRNCTLRERFEIGVVKEDSKGSEAGWDIMQAIFDDLAGRYNIASERLGIKTMNMHVF